MTEETRERPADAQPGMLVLVRKDNILPDRFPTMIMDPRFLIEQGIIPKDHSERLVIMVNNKNFTPFADEVLRANMRMVRLDETKKVILYQLEDGRIVLEH